MYSSFREIPMLWVAGGQVGGSMYGNGVSWWVFNGIWRDFIVNKNWNNNMGI